METVNTHAAVQFIPNKNSTEKELEEQLLGTFLKGEDQNLSAKRNNITNQYLLSS